MTESVLKNISATTWKYKEPKQRFTCLREPFYITKFAPLKFTYNGKEYEEDFNIFPKRKDNHILIGRKFMEEQNTKGVNEIKEWPRQTGKETKEETMCELLERLCSVNNKKIEDIHCTIPTLSNEKVSGGSYQIPYAEEEKINEEINRLLDLGYIRPSKSLWLNKMKPVPKDNGRYRITLNFIKLNKLVVLDQYLLPNMEEMLYKLKGQKFFSKIDLKERFYYTSSKRK